MGLKYDDLILEVRAFMVEEIDMDEREDRIYRSSYLSQRAQGNWPDMIRDAAKLGTDDTLAAEIHRTASLNATTTRTSIRGRVFTAKVPYNAAEVLAECEFNRYFCRGLARHAGVQGIARLEVYRAKQVAQPRQESEAKIGLLVDPGTILLDLRASRDGFEPALGIPPGPGSGITLRIPKK